MIPDHILKLKALGNDTRCRIVGELLHGPQVMGDLASRVGLSQFSVSRHVRALREAGIVECERSGSFVVCRIPGPFKVFQDRFVLLDLGFCTLRFDRNEAEEVRRSLDATLAGETRLTWRLASPRDLVRR